MRSCRKCKVNKTSSARKYCDSCKIKPKNCACGKSFRSKTHQHCKFCRNVKGNDGICSICSKARHIYYSTGACSTCYKFLTKYKLSKESYIKLREIEECQICSVPVSHSAFNRKSQAVIDHDHATGVVRGVVCVNCNIILGMLRSSEHLEFVYKAYDTWVGRGLCCE
jgi:hypothetical protein